MGDEVLYESETSPRLARCYALHPVVSDLEAQGFSFLTITASLERSSRLVTRLTKDKTIRERPLSTDAWWESVLHILGSIDHLSELVECSWCTIYVTAPHLEDPTSTTFPRAFWIAGSIQPVKSLTSTQASLLFFFRLLSRVWLGKQELQLRSLPTFYPSTPFP